MDFEVRRLGPGDEDAVHAAMPTAALARVPHALVVRPAMIGAALAETAARRTQDDVDGGSRTR